MFSEKNGFRLQVHVFVAQIFVSHKKPFSVHGMLPAKWSARIIYKLPVLGIYDKGDATKPLIFLEEIRSADVDQRRRAFYWFGWFCYRSWFYMAGLKMIVCNTSLFNDCMHFGVNTRWEHKINTKENYKSWFVLNAIYSCKNHQAEVLCCLAFIWPGPSVGLNKLRQVLCGTFSSANGHLRGAWLTDSNLQPQWLPMLLHFFHAFKI